MTNNFRPIIGETKTLTATTGGVSITLGPQTVDYMIVNAGTSEAFFRHGPAGSSVIASTTTDVSIPSGAIYTLQKPENHIIFNGITASGTATLRITPGWGN